MKYFAIAAVVAATSFSALPASAAMMKCTSENMAKSMTASGGMPDTPQKMAMMKEIGMANTAMSKGDMRGACRSYMKAQKMGSMKMGMMKS